MTLNGVETWACPRRTIKDNPEYWSTLFALYKPYSLGVLADEGNLSAQSAKYVKTMAIFDTYLGNARGEAMEQERSKASRPQR